MHCIKSNTCQTNLGKNGQLLSQAIYIYEEQNLGKNGQLLSQAIYIYEEQNTTSLFCKQSTVNG